MEKLKAVIIGGGSFGEVHLQHFSGMPQVEVGGVYTLEKERGEQLCKQYGGKNYSSVEDIAKDAEIDLVSIVTPENVHFEIYKKFAGTGKSVYVEKPLTTNLREAQKMAELSAEFPVAMSGHLLRFESRIAQVKCAVSGKNVRHLSFSRKRNHAQREIYSRVHPVWSVISHDIDLANYFAGRKFLSVNAQETYFSGGNNPDYISVQIEYEGGLTTNIEGGWVLPTNCGITENDSCTIITDEDCFELRLPNDGLFSYTANGTLAANHAYGCDVYGTQYGALRNALDYFVNCVACKIKPEINSIEDAVQAVEIAEEILKSVKEKKY